MSGTVQPLQTASQTIASGGYGAQPVGFGYYPTEGSRVVTLAYNWGTQLSYSEDLAQALVAHGIETAIQGIFVDNSSNAETVQIIIQGTGQLIVVPPTSQGIFPAFFPPGASFSIQSATVGEAVGLPANQVTRVYLLNVPPQAAGIWAAPPIGSASLQALLAPIAGGTTKTMNITTTTALKPAGTVGRIAKVIVLTTTAVGTITFSDGAEGAANNFFQIPIGATAGTIYDLNVPFVNGCNITFDGGATGTLTVTFQ